MEILNFNLSLILKDKGFNLPCKGYYFFGKYTDSLVDWRNSDDTYLKEANFCTAPYLEQVGEWLRNEHFIHISIDVTQIYYYFKVSKIPNNNAVTSEKFETYEEAYIKAIEFVINNLI